MVNLRAKLIDLRFSTFSNTPHNLCSESLTNTWEISSNSVKKSISLRIFFQTEYIKNIYVHTNGHTLIQRYRKNSEIFNAQNQESYRIECDGFGRIQREHRS